MNYIQRVFSELVEENGGVVISVLPFRFRGSALVVGFVEYYGYDCVLIGNSIYEVFPLFPSSSTLLFLCLREDGSIELREDGGLELRE